MNDALYEQLVARKSRSTDMLIRVLVIVVIAAVAVFGMAFIGIFSFFIAAILGVLAYYFVFPRLAVEYEYSLLNHEMDIDIIYNKEKRKKGISFDIQEAEMIAPANSPELRSFSPAKTYDYSSGTNSSGTYAILLPMDQALTRILIEPDAEMIKHMRSWMGSKMKEM